MSCVVVALGASPASGERLTKERYGQMLTAGLAALFDPSDAATVLRRLFPSGAVGLKTNCVAHKFNSTPVNLSLAVADVIVSPGRNANDVVVWDRTSRELQQAGYELNASSFGLRCLGTDACPGTYGREFFTSGEVSSLVSNILTEMVAHSINLPVLKDHSLAGLSGGMKNMYGAINNPNKWHGNNCDPYAAHVNDLAPIRTKHRLTITDAVRVQYQNGPGYDAGYVYPYGGLIMSTDPVAADAVGLQILEHIRGEKGLPTLAEAGRPASHVTSAAALGLGVADLDAIDLRVIDVDESGGVRQRELFR